VIVVVFAGFFVVVVVAVFVVVVVAVFVVVVADPSALGDVVPKQLQSHKKISMGFISRFFL
jgi:hypothetical protein